MDPFADLLEWGISALFVALLGWWSATRATSKAIRAWAAAADTCGLTNLEKVRVFGLIRGLTAKSGDLCVRLGAYGAGEEKDRVRGTSVVIENRGPGRTSLTLLQGDFGRGRKIEERQLVVGDPQFDEEFIVDGPPGLARAVLDAETRRLLHSLRLGAELLIVDGEVRAKVDRGSSDEAHSTLVSALPMLLDVARRVSRPDDIVVRLADNARLDPKPAVRVHNLVTLIRQYPEEPVTREVLR